MERTPKRARLGGPSETIALAAGGFESSAGRRRLDGHGYRTPSQLPKHRGGMGKDCESDELGQVEVREQDEGKDVATTVVPPATEPLKTGDEYVVKVGGFMKICCRVLESPSLGAATGEDGEMVFDAMGVALGGIVNARFRFTVFRGEDGVVMARAQDK